MKKLFTLAMLVAIMAAPAFAQSSADATVSVGLSIGPKLTATTEANLFFGTSEDLVIGDSLSLDPTSGSVTNTGSATIDDGEAGRVSFLGAANAQVYITVKDSASTTLTVDGGSATQTAYISINDGTNPTHTTEAALTNGSITVTLDAQGEGEITVGGGLKIESITSGFYRGEFVITVSYF